MSARLPVRMPRLEDLLTPGTLKDDFEVTKHLGAGAFSEVKLAKNRATGQKCAVKILARNHAEFNEELLVLEVDFMMRVKDHPNIVDIHAVYADADAVYIVMEHMCAPPASSPRRPVRGQRRAQLPDPWRCGRAGGELFDIIVKRAEKAGSDARPYSEQHVATIMNQITAAIVHCHSKQVAHRDLKVSRLPSPSLHTTPSAAPALRANARCCRSRKIC